MTPPSHAETTAYDRELVDALTGGFPWTLSRTSAGGDLREVPTGEIPTFVECRLVHHHTDATLYVTVPADTGYAAASLALYHSLDETFANRSSGFVRSLSCAHATIAEIYAGEYLTPVTDPHLILVGRIPFTYSERKLHETMTAITTTATRVERLHARIRSPVGELLVGRGPA